MDRIVGKIADWKRRLVDLSRRNRLLFFRPSRSSVEVIAPSLEEVFQHLVLDRESWKFFTPPEEAEERNLPIGALHLPRAPLDVDPDIHAAIPERAPDELLCRTRDAHKLKSSLRALHRRSRDEFEERGIRVLHIAFGLLEWRETSATDAVRSPLVLVPAEITRETVTDPFELSIAEDDVLRNSALDAKLRSDFGLELPPFPENWETIDLGAYLDQVSTAVGPLGWNVLQACWIGTFSFHKLVIYQDLNDPTHLDLIKQHPVIRALAGAGDPRDFAVDDLADPEELDAIVDPKDSYLVANADSSQLACIEAVKRGASLVIQGPPGTGKSQTITNLIADAIARGRSVLFVSEKMAALEVVHKRLRDVGLDHYCLELHSHNAKKRDVVQKLYRSYLSSLHPKTVMTEAELQGLRQRCAYLSDYVYELHRVRPPLGRPVFDVLGELSFLHAVPYVALGHGGTDSWTAAYVDRCLQAARRLASLWSVVVEADEFPWCGCTIDSYSLEAQAQVQSLLTNCKKSLANLQAAYANVAEELDIRSPHDVPTTKRLYDVVGMLSKTPAVESNWLLNPTLEPFVADAKKYAQLSSSHRSLKAGLSKRYTDSFLQLPPELLTSLAAALREMSSLMGRDVGSDWTLFSKRAELFNWAPELIARIEDWQRDAATLCSSLGLSLAEDVESLHRVLRIAGLCASSDPPDLSWFERGRLIELCDELPRIRARFATRERMRTQVLERYEESILTMDLERVFDALSTSYATALRWLKPGFYILRRHIRRCRKDRRPPSNLREDLRTVRDLLRLEAAIESDAERARQLLGLWYRGYDTKFAQVENAIAVTKELYELTSDDVPQEVVLQASRSTPPSLETQRTTKRLGDSLREWAHLTDSVDPLELPLERIPTTRLPLNQSRLQDVLVWAKQFRAVLSDIGAAYDLIEATLLEPRELPPIEALEDLRQLCAMRKLESDMLPEVARLEKTFGRRFAGLATDWDAVLDAMAWTHEFRTTFGSGPMSERIVGLAQSGGFSATRVTFLREVMQLLERDLAAVLALFASAPTDGGTSDGTTVITLRGGVFKNIERLLSALEARIDELRDWVDLKELKSDFAQIGLGEFLGQVTRHRDVDATEIPDIARRALLSAWVNEVFHATPALRRFRTQDHEAVIAEFRALDRKHYQTGAYRVMLEAEKRKPRNETIQPGGEAATLAREANKKTRHLPLRQLFAQTPRLLSRLKPCLLMSPLSVSQFLDPAQFKFDLVIFDEASQINSEESVGSIYRGRQLVVCGDKLQLPPTAFFEQTTDDELEDLDAEETFDSFPSVLAELESIGLPQRWLHWHYRSRHEHLIAFSNHRFYENRLVTFPASRQEHPQLGVQFVYLPDGVYDRGGKRDNSREADKVIQLVEDHFLRTPDRSLGVVAFSVAQRDAIEDRLERFRQDRPELERYFTADRLDGFFVKNLESVQGDERDVIIFSIGYGRDPQGRLTMHFGPLNAEGGEKRLNVAVTRAREQVIVVSSIRAADFDLTGPQRPGVSSLYHYLDYAERGLAALTLEDTPFPGDYESPLEQDVAGVIRSLGYEAIPQVGCSGFRIDLGVVDPAMPGRFIAGVECDGATYHSAHTARDRDRLRQEILEQLGWRIHRVWSPDWLNRRQHEIRRLQEAIEAARAAATRGDGPVPSQHGGASRAPAIEVQIAEPTLPGEHEFPHWVSLYRTCKTRTRIPRDLDMHDPNALPVICRVVCEVVRTEGPVHKDVVAQRVVRAWKLQRVGTRATATLEIAFARCYREGDLRIEGDFLWPPERDMLTPIRRPDVNDQDSARRIELICDEEIEHCMLRLTADAMSIDSEHLLGHTARIFGFDRMGGNVRGSLTNVLQSAVRRKLLFHDNGRVSRVRMGSEPVVEANTATSLHAPLGSMTLTCPNCGQKNRVPANRRADAICGRCHTRLYIT